MKSGYLILFLLTVLSCGCVGKTSEQAAKENRPATRTLTDTIKENTSIEIDNVFYDFEDITEGDNITHSYNVTNTGKYPLQIRKFQASCNCTEVKYPEIIRPVESAYIDVSFNSSGKRGFQYKEIIIFANIEKKLFKLSFSAYVNNKQLK